jgi:hypothetical protein
MIEASVDPSSMVKKPTICTFFGISLHFIHKTYNYLEALKQSQHEYSQTTKNKLQAGILQLSIKLKLCEYKIVEDKFWHFMDYKILVRQQITLFQGIEHVSESTFF